jgi:small-conductance mechanosensitive channel
MPLRNENIQGVLSSYVFYGCYFTVWIVFVWIFFAFLQPAYAQKPLTPTLNVSKTHAPEDVSTTNPESGVPQTEQEINNKIESLRELLVNVRRSIQSAKVKAESTTSEQLGVSSSEIQRKELLIIKKSYVYEQHIEAYHTLLEARRASRGLTAEIDNWKGFDTPPPYPVSLLDELRDAIETKKLEIKKDRIKKSIAEDDLKNARSILQESEQHLRQVKEKLEDIPASTDRVQLNWLRDLYQLENEIASTQIIAAETQRQVMNEVLAYRHKSLNFMERKLKVAAANAPFTKEELDKKNKTIEERIKTIKDELSQANRNDMKRQERLQNARQELDKARESLANRKEDAEKNTDEIERLQRVVDVRKAWADTTSLIAEGLKLFLNGLNAEQLFLEKRYRLVSTGNDAELREAEQEITSMLEKLRNTQFHYDSDLKLTISTLLNERRRLATLSSEDKENEFVSLTIDAYEKRTASLERRLAYINEFIRGLERFLEEIKGRRQQWSFGERMNVVFSIVLLHAENIWNFELFTAEDTILVDGQSIIERRPITISKVVRALLVLGIGLWLSGILARIVHSTSVKHFKADPSIASLVKKTFYTVSAVCVVTFAMITVKIPLTVFAFMGGTLAVGIGFGAKDLINNFISGAILLFERPIKVGDVVEIEGMRGKVVRIGGRCSQIRRFDGIDILVPNSSLLEKDVVNWTLSDNLLRLKVSVGVAYGTSSRDVAGVITNTVDEHGRVLKDPRPNVIFEDFGDSALIFTVYFWVEVTPEADFRIVESDIRHMLDKRLRDAGVTVAFPQCDIHVDSSRPIKVQINESHSKLLLGGDENIKG